MGVQEEEEEEKEEMVSEILQPRRGVL